MKTDGCPCRKTGGFKILVGQELAATDDGLTLGSEALTFPTLGYEQI
jgi:hypothetical protein